MNPSKIEWDRIPTDPVQEVAIELLDTPDLGVRSVGPVGDFLEWSVVDGYVMILFRKVVEYHINPNTAFSVSPQP